MATISDDAVVLTRLDYSETSQVIVLFMREHGKVRAIAKGIKRHTKTRFAVGIDLLDIGHVVLSAHPDRSDALATVTEWNPVGGVSGLREKLHRIYAGQYAAEITGSLTEDWDPHPGLYDALVGTLAALAEAEEPLAAVAAYQLMLLESIGSCPRFDVCVLCDRVNPITHFSSFEGGVICRGCEAGQIEKWELSPATLDLLRAARMADAAPAALTGAFAVLNYHIAHLMGRQPRLASKLLPSPRTRNDR